jgi:two-component system CheB/CheR fusion protein
MQNDPILQRDAIQEDKSSGNRSLSPRRKALIGACAVLLPALLCAFWFVSLYERNQISKQKTSLTEDLKTHASSLKQTMGSHARDLISLKNFVEQKLAGGSDNFEEDVDYLLPALFQHTSGTRNISIAPDGVQRYVYPPQERERIAGHDLRRDPRTEVGADVARSIATGAVTLSGPYPLRQGDAGLVMRQAVSVDGRFWGLVAKVIDLSSIIETALGSSDRWQMRFALQDHSGRLFAGDRTVLEQDPAAARVELPEGYWTLSAVPQNGWSSDPGETFSVKLLALLVALLLGLVSYLLLYRGERLRRQVARRTRELRQYAKIVSGSSDMLALVARDGRYLAISDSYLAAFNVTRERIVGTTQRELLGAEAYDASRAERVAQCLAGDTVRFEVWHDLPAWGRRCMDVTYTPYEEAGVILGFIVGARDITPRKQAELERERLMQAVEQLSEAIIITDLQGTIEYANPALEKISGYSIAEVLGKNPRLFSSGHHDEAFYEQLWGTLLSGRTWHGEMVNRRKDGFTYTEEAVISPIFDQQGAIVNLVAIKSDISQRKRNDEERSRLLAKLEQVNEDLEQLLFITSHDMRAPLVPIEGFAGLLQDASGRIIAALPEEQRRRPELVKDREICDEATEFMVRGVEQMNTMIDGLLKVSRLGRVELELAEVDVNGVMHDVISEHSFAAGQQGAKIEYAGLPSCYGDRSQIVRLFSNLVGNALKYADPQRPCQIRVTAQQHEGAIEYCVEDNGIGIPEAKQEEVFHLFKRLDSSSPGEGLGLSLARKIVARHNGSIRLSSEVGKGSRFFVTLPRSPSS